MPSRMVAGSHRKRTKNWHILREERNRYFGTPILPGDKKAEPSGLRFILSRAELSISPPSHEQEGVIQYRRNGLNSRRHIG